MALVLHCWAAVLAVGAAAAALPDLLAQPSLAAAPHRGSLLGEDVMQLDFTVANLSGNALTDEQRFHLSRAYASVIAGACNISVVEVHEFFSYSDVIPTANASEASAEAGSEGGGDGRLTFSALIAAPHLLYPGHLERLIRSAKTKAQLANATDRLLGSSPAILGPLSVVDVHVASRTTPAPTTTTEEYAEEIEGTPFWALAFLAAIITACAGASLAVCWPDKLKRDRMRAARSARKAARMASMHRRETEDPREAAAVQALPSGSPLLPPGPPPAAQVQTAPPLVAPVYRVAAVNYMPVSSTSVVRSPVQAVPPAA